MQYKRMHQSIVERHSAAVTANQGQVLVIGIGGHKVMLYVYIYIG